MKAKDLIKILEKNPEQEVKFYNGFVNDWMDVSIAEEDLVKEKPSYILMLSNYTRKEEGLPLHTKEDVKKWKRGRNWEIQNEFVDYEENKKYYSFKRVFMINAKRRGKFSFDRMGEIEY